MKIKLEYVNEETGVKVIIKNKGDKVYIKLKECQDNTLNLN